MAIKVSCSIISAQQTLHTKGTSILKTLIQSISKLSVGRKVGASMSNLKIVNQGSVLKTI